jgi:hypothetical protein
MMVVREIMRETRFSRDNHLKTKGVDMKLFFEKRIRKFSESFLKNAPNKNNLRGLAVLPRENSILTIQLLP